MKTEIDKKDLNTLEGEMLFLIDLARKGNLESYSLLTQNKSIVKETCDAYTSTPGYNPVFAIGLKSLIPEAKLGA